MNIEPILANTQHLSALAQPLLRWYDRNARLLPWREQPTPYRVWVSEIMLQQTRVEAVRPYFDRFLEALPNIRALAEADEALLLKLWEGLGYYNRVRNLQRAAKMTVELFAGELPREYERLLTLPGIGDYTAGAIASIAYGCRVPAVDGNVLRVLARILACDADIAQGQVRRAFREAAQGMLPESRVGDFNQAMMELGATVCLPNAAPRCGECPLSTHCAAYQHGSPQAYPVKAPKPSRRIERRTVLIVAGTHGVLLHRRKENGLLQGLWELPNVEGWLSNEEAAAIVAAWGGSIRQIEPARAAKHIFTHIEWHMQGFLLQTDCFPPPEGCVWADEEAIRTRYALPSAFGAYKTVIMLRKLGSI